jgi:hypothetical protein
MPKALVWSLMLALGLLPATGCVVRTIPVAAAAAVPTTSWVRQVQIKIPPPSSGPRVASATTSSWNLVQLKIGRLDGSMPIMALTFDPFDGPPGSRAWDSLTPGGGYWVQADLVHVNPDGRELIVGSGRLGGDGEDVTFNPGSNTIPIVVEPTTAGGRLDMAPTPLRLTSHHTSDTSIHVSTSSSTSDDEDDEVWFDDGGDDSDDDDEHDDSSDDSDGDVGDWSDSAMAFKRPSGILP